MWGSHITQGLCKPTQAHAVALVLGCQYFQPPKQELGPSQAFSVSVDTKLITATGKKQKNEDYTGISTEQRAKGACLIRMPRSNYPDTCWESNTAGWEQSRRLLEGIKNKFLVQVLDKQTRGEALLDLVLINADELISRNIKLLYFQVVTTVLWSQNGTTLVSIQGCEMAREVTCGWKTNEIKCTLIQLADKIELSGAAEGWNAIQRDLGKLKKWVHENVMRFNKARYKVLQLDWGNSKYQHRLGDEQIQSSPAQQDSGMLLDERLDMSWQWALTAQKTNRVLGCTQSSMGSREGRGSCPSALLSQASLEGPPCWQAAFHYNKAANFGYRMQLKNSGEVPSLEKKDKRRYSEKVRDTGAALEALGGGLHAKDEI
ncbi:hypothetical protein TURU_123692 [Turdus rufiventris]|nr:hypothetical protein TURU_123692 [Turdus rufiventris]